MDKDKDSQPVQGTKISRLTRNRPTQEKSYLRIVREIATNAADKGLSSRKQTIELVKLMMRIEDSPSKFKSLKILANTSHIEYLKLFLDNYGLKILYLWMVRCKEADFYLKIAILKVLAALPVSNKTTLKTTKVWDLLEKWSNSTKENGQDDIQLVCVDSSDEHNDKDIRLSNKVCVSDHSKEENNDMTEIVKLEEDCDQQKSSQTKNVDRCEINNNCGKNIISITLDSDCDEIIESQVQTKCTDQSGIISDNFVQNIIKQISVILKRRKLSSTSEQSDINLESSLKDNTILDDKEPCIEPSRVSISSADALSDCHSPLDTKTEDNLSESKDKVNNCNDNKSSSKQKNWTASDVSILALKLLEQWKDLKEVFIIPKIKATKPVEIEKNNKKPEEITDPSKTPNNVDKNKKDNNQRNKKSSGQKNTTKAQDVPEKSKVHRKKQRVRRRNRRFERFEKFRCSYPQPEFRYQIGPQDYLGLYPQSNLNYEYYPSYYCLNQLPCQMTSMNNYQ